jgi:putative transcriptional regulator
MKKDLFEELLASVQEGGAILKGRRSPARRSRIDAPQVRELREAYGLSQERFAALMGISVATLRNWEQGRRQPEGSARVLLEVVAKHPEAVLDVVSSTSREGSKGRKRSAPRSVRARGQRGAPARRRART